MPGGKLPVVPELPHREVAMSAAATLDLIISFHGNS
jgi:hypothetical protein